MMMLNNEMQQKEATRSAPGRICLVGEDIDWISGPSVLCAVDLRICVNIKPCLDNHCFIKIKSSEPINYFYSIMNENLADYNGHESDYIRAALIVFSEYGVNLKPISITIKSNLPAKAGLSSSAALLVSTISALCDYFQVKISNQEVCHLAYLAENRELKTGVGQMDLYSCGLGGIIYLNSATVPPCPIEKFKMPNDINVVIADTLTPRNTAEVIRKKQKRLSESDPLLLSYVDKTLVAIDEMRILLSNSQKNIKEIGEIIFTCHDYLKNYLQVSTELLDECVERCKKNGAYGAKLTGTGMGGCMFAFVEKSNTKNLISSLAGLPIKVYLTSITELGIH